MAFEPRLRDALRAEAAAVEPDVDDGLEVVRRRSGRRSAIHPVAFAVLAVAAVAVLVLRAGGVPPLGTGPSAPQPGGLSVGPAPHVCELISANELSSIVGHSVTLISPESETSTPTTSTSSCVYEYEIDSSGLHAIPNIILSITRYQDPTVARAQVGLGPGNDRAVPGLGDSSATYYHAPTAGLLALKGMDVLDVGGMTSGVSDPLDVDQTIAIARIILARL